MNDKCIIPDYCSYLFCIFRLSEQAQRHLRGSEHFEDILMGANRPSLVVQKFQEIYSQERIEAYDYIVDVTGLEEDIFISAFLLDILKVRERRGRAWKY